MPTYPANPDQEAASSYHVLYEAAHEKDAAVQATLLLRKDGSAAASAAAAGQCVFYLDPALYTVGSRSLKLLLTATVITNATAPTSTFTFGLYPVTASAGGAAAVSVTVGTVTSGSTVAFAAPAASSLNYSTSGDFAFPSAGFFALGVVISVADMVANSAADFRAVLRVRAT